MFLETLTFCCVKMFYGLRKLKIMEINKFYNKDIK